MRQLFELCGEDRSLCFSPFVWRVLFCLKHKRLEFERTPTMFLEKEGYLASGSNAVPVFRDGDTWVSDSLEIARYLERSYPEHPLFGSDIALGQAKFLNSWFDSTITAGLFPMLAADVCAILSEENADYFRKTREPRLGGPTLEEAASGREAALPAFRASLGLMRGTIEVQGFLSGEAPAWADYAAIGPFVWASVVAPDFKILTDDDPVFAWSEKMFDLFDGLARNAPKRP